MGVAVRIVLCSICIVEFLLGVSWFARSLNLVNVHFQGQEHRLITDGPFNYVRHPLYTALLMTLPPLLVLWYADLVFIAPWVLVLIVAHYVVRLEERELIEAFDDGYRRYQKYVPALLLFRGSGGRRYREDG